MTPDFSIITCTRNSAATLPQTLQSIQQQRGVSFEQVFVDGDSTDATLDLLRAVPGQTTLLTGVRGGIARAMNAGAQVAQGDVLCHLHSDDYFLHPGVLRRVANHFQSSRLNWMFGRILSDIEGALLPEPFQVPEYSYRRLVQGNFIPHPATFIRTKVFNDLGGFRDNLRFAMDYEFFLRLAQQYEPLALREAFSVFRRHGGSTTQKNRLASFEEDHQVRLQYAGSNPVDRMMHLARYHIRKRRLLAQLAIDTRAV